MALESKKLRFFHAIEESFLKQLLVVSKTGPTAVIKLRQKILLNVSFTLYVVDILETKDLLALNPWSKATTLCHISFEKSENPSHMSSTDRRLLHRTQKLFDILNKNRKSTVTDNCFKVLSMHPVLPVLLSSLSSVYIYELDYIRYLDCCLCVPCPNEQMTA